MHRIVQACCNCLHHDLTIEQRPCSVCQEVDGGLSKFEIPEWHKQIFEDAKRWRWFIQGYEKAERA